MDMNSWTNAIIALLSEAYAGPPDPRSTWFIDNEPDSGILGILAGVTAAVASTSVDGSGRPGTTIASHAEHLRWSLANANAAMRDQPYRGNWSESWNTLGADEVFWDRLRQDLRVEFETASELIRQQTALEDEAIFGLMALIPHAAYHLGNIRQMVERARADKSHSGGSQ